MLQAGQLQFGDYNWTPMAHDDPRVHGRPDSTPLNRKEGYEVLAFINYYVQEHSRFPPSVLVGGLSEEQAAQKVERMIRLAPAGLVSRAQVGAWIERNWTTYR